MKNRHGKLTHDEDGYLIVWLVWSCREIRIGSAIESYLVAVCTSEKEAGLRKTGIENGNYGHRLAWVEPVQTDHQWGEMMDRKIAALDAARKAGK